MGLVVVLVLALLLLAGLWRFGRLDRAGLQLVGAALLFALAGYAWQGRPELPGSPKRAAVQHQAADTAFASLRRELLGRFDTADSWLTTAESYARAGDTVGAARLISSAIRAHPRNSSLWIGYGHALAAHSGGVVTPAAELAFQRAAALAPNHPAPRFFHALALAQGGRLDEAEAMWRSLLASPLASAAWRGAAERQLMLVDRARAMAAMQGQGPGQGPGR